MLSNRTLLDLIMLADTFTHSEINRIVVLFNFTPLPSSRTNSIQAKTTDIFRHLKYNSGKAPFTGDIHIDFLQYLIDDFFRKRPFFENGHSEYRPTGPPLTLENAFILSNKEIGNSLKRDGYIVVGKIIKKLLPQEIVEAKIESELVIVLEKLSFATTSGHLSQAIVNHSQGNWASANSQFRSFIESLLIEICNCLIPANDAKTGGQAIKLLTESLTPAFLSKTLNEVPKDKDSDSFVFGLWARLHPDGSHPGLSDEDDCSFRYHMTIVFANYLLRRLADRKISNN